MEAGGSFRLGWLWRMGQSGSRAQFFWIPAISPWQATADASHGTGKKRVVLHSSGDGKQASEGVVVGMVSGSADAHGWMSVGCYFL